MFWNDEQYDNLSNDHNDYELEIWGGVYESSGMNSEDACWSMINSSDEEEY